MDLPRYGLVTFTWGNVSAIDRECGLFVIKPSGVDYDKLTPEMMVVMDLNGNKVEGDLNPSSDTATHLELYKAFPEIGGIVHTHSSYATSWAQAGRDIPCYGTTQADYIYGPVPCVRCLTKEEIEDAYEENTGHLIVNEFKRLGKDPKAVPAVLCKNHGPFAWGKDYMGEHGYSSIGLVIGGTHIEEATIFSPSPSLSQDQHLNAVCHGQRMVDGF